MFQIILIIWGVYFKGGDVIFRVRVQPADCNMFCKLYRLFKA